MKKSRGPNTKAAAVALAVAFGVSGCGTAAMKVKTAEGGPTVAPPISADSSGASLPHAPSRAERRLPVVRGRDRVAAGSASVAAPVVDGTAATSSPAEAAVYVAGAPIAVRDATPALVPSPRRSPEAARMTAVRITTRPGPPAGTGKPGPVTRPAKPAQANKTGDTPGRAPSGGGSQLTSPTQPDSPALPAPLSLPGPAGSVSNLLLTNPLVNSTISDTTVAQPLGAGSLDASPFLIPGGATSLTTVAPLGAAGMSYADGTGGVAVVAVALQYPSGGSPSVDRALLSALGSPPAKYLDSAGDTITDTTVDAAARTAEPRQAVVTELVTPPGSPAGQWWSTVYQFDDDYLSVVSASGPSAAGSLLNADDLAVIADFEMGANVGWVDSGT